MTRTQLLELGFSGRVIDREVKRRDLLVEHRGVYAVGHASKSFEGVVMSAVLACGPGAAAAHRTAAQLLKFLPLDAQFEAVDVVVPSRARRGSPRIRVHHANLAPNDTLVKDCIPVTSPARTLLDLAGGPHTSEFEQAFDEAVFRGRIRAPQINDVIERYPGYPGVARLRALWQAEEASERNRLEAENRMAALIKAAKLPGCLSNAPIGDRTVDFLWPEHRVVVEIDGYRTHGKRSSFEADRARDADLQALGYSVLRFTWRQVTREQYVVVARLAALLALAERSVATGG